MGTNLTVFEDYNIRRIYDEETETSFFSVVDIIRALTQQANRLENTIISKTGGGIAKKARMELESKTGKKVVTTQDYLPTQQSQKKIVKAEQE